MSGLRIQLAADHPHAGEFGILAGDDLAGKLGRDRRTPVGGRLVQLENCAHGTDCCYVFTGQFRTICTRSRSLPPEQTNKENQP